MDKRIELLQKIQSLANCGLGGEKTNAEALLCRLLKKYHISEDDLSENVPVETTFTFHGAEQRQLLIQLVYKVTNETGRTFGYTYTRSNRPCRTQLGACVTAAQAAEIRFLFDFYVRQWESERKALLRAFIQKHDLFGVPPEDENETPMPNEELFKMSRLMSGLTDVSPVRRLEQNV